MSDWKISQHEYKEGDEVLRTYNNETGHVMAIQPGSHGVRYKVTSPSNPQGYTWEWDNYLEPSTGLPRLPAPSQPIPMPPPPPANGQYPPLQTVPDPTQQPMSAVESKKKKCHYCSNHANAFYVYHVGVCHDHDPPPPTPPAADVTPTPTSKVGWSFQDAAAEELKAHEALARDIMRTLPESEWPEWVKNQAHDMVWGVRQPIDWTPYPHKDALDTTPSQTTFPEDWNF